jgi:PKD repeat protein
MFLAKYTYPEPIILKVGNEVRINQDPVADAGGPYVGIPRQDIQFDGSNSYDPDPVGPIITPNGIVRYLWDFGDGNTSNSEKPKHSYNNPDTYIVTLTVWDDMDATDTDITYASVEGMELAPSANANGPYEGHVGKPVQFSGSATGGNPPYEYHWDFGDGNISNEQKPSHIYKNVGEYTIVFTVTDDNDNSDDDETTAMIYPTEVLIADADGPYKVLLNEPVEFKGSATGGQPPYSWFWDFGNGYNSTEQNPVYTYSTQGVYNVVLTVTDDLDQTDNDDAIVYIIYDVQDPNVEIIQPSTGIYFNDRRWFSILGFTLVIGSIDIEVIATDDQSEIDYVEFLIDGDKRHMDTTEPYNWTWSQRLLGMHIIKVIAYDIAGNSATDVIGIWKLF